MPVGAQVADPVGADRLAAGLGALMVQTALASVPAESAGSVAALAADCLSHRACHARLANLAASP
jgi:hypothetical protein